MRRTLEEVLADATNRIHRYTPAEAHDADAVLVDIRSQDTRERDGAIPGARHVPRTVLEWRVDPDQLSQPFAGGRTSLLSPFDAIVRDRKRMEDLFEFDYVLEMYKPAAQRRWGYFALPVLHGDRLVGKLDATADRKAGRLFVDAVHEDVPFTKAVTSAVDAEIAALADRLGLAVAR